MAAAPAQIDRWIGLRVLIVSNHFIASQTEWLPALSRMGVDLHLLASTGHESHEGFPVDFTVPQGVVPHPYTPKTLRPSADHLWWLVPRLREIVSQLRPDVVHVLSEAWGMLVIQALATRLPVVVHGADNKFTFGARWESTVRVAVARRNLRRVAGYISWNAKGLALARAYGLPSSVPTAVTPAYAPNPDLLARMSALKTATRRRLGITDDTFAVGFVGRLNEQKGFDQLLSAGRQLSAELGGNFKLVVVGDGPAAACLTGDSRLWLSHLGARPWSQTVEVLAAMDAIAVPSVTLSHPVEQFGRVVVEAFFAGVPVVTSDSGALPEVVGAAGLIVPERDVESLAAALLRVAMSGELRQQLSLLGRERAITHYSPHAVATRLLSVWEQAC